MMCVYIYIERKIDCICVYIFICMYLGLYSICLLIFLLRGCIGF